MTSFMVVTAFCTLLSVATSATAECAWVLWAWSPTAPTAFPNRYEPLGAYATQRACLAAQESGFSYGHQVGQKSLVRCLPDTVDPRGPKGK